MTSCWHVLNIMIRVQIIAMKWFEMLHKFMDTKLNKIVESNKFQFVRLKCEFFQRIEDRLYIFVFTRCNDKVDIILPILE